MNSNWFRPFCVVALFCYMLVVGGNANATEQRVSDYVYNGSEQFSISAKSGASSDFLIVNQNEPLVGLNFDKFKVSSKPLLIKVSNDSSLKTLLITANIFDINNSISIVGKPIDLLLVSNGGKVTCKQCSFENVGRITFVNGAFINDTISTSEGGLVAISNLSAPGAQSLELMADNIETSGLIDLNLRADYHPQGGFIQSEQGSRVLGAGGINLYPGRFEIKYSNLDMLSTTTKSSQYQPAGTLKAASIGIVAAQPVTIPGDTEMNTLSDAIATSTRQGDFYAPSEGIFIQIAKHETAPLKVYGKLYSDKIVTTKSIGPTNFYSGARLIGDSIKVLSDSDVHNNAYLDAALIEVGAQRLLNSGLLNAPNISIETEGDVYNEFGGVIKARQFKAVLSEGVFTNGSRTNKSYRPSKQSIIAPSIKVDSVKHGPYYNYARLGTTQSNLSAKILADSIKITARAIENINPYHIEEPAGIDWKNGIRVNSVETERVYISAESRLELKATDYIRNTSAIMRLNQNGVFHIDTPLMFNERYRLETTSYVISRYAYTEGKAGSLDTIEQGAGTKIAAYSPPGRIISFGQFEIGSKAKPTTRRRLVNAFSYLEVFSDARFQALDLESVGITLGSTISQDDYYTIKQCIAHGVCAGQSINTSLQGETLLSFHGNVFGINGDIELSSDFTKKNSDSQLSQQESDIEQYLSRYVNYETKDVYSGFSSYKIENGIVKAYLYNCNGFRLEEHGLTRVRNCRSSMIRIRYSDIQAEVSQAEFENTGYTFKQIRDTATSYAKKRQPVTGAEDSRCRDYRYDCKAQNFAYQDVVVSDAGKMVTIIYKYQIAIDLISDDHDTPFIRYVTKSPKISVATLMSGK